MKLVFLNTLNGQMESGISRFLEEQAKDTQVFCLQESKGKMLELARKIFGSDYDEFVAHKVISEDNRFDQATYIHKNMQVLEHEVLASGVDGIGLGIYLKLSYAKNRIINVINIHGVATPGDKKDNPARLKQSKLFLGAANKCIGPTVLGGDFNLDIDTESVKMIERDGWTNLIRNCGIKTTRNELTWRKYPNSPQYYADYVFANNEISVGKFEVPRLLISDHEPMILEII